MASDDRIEARSSRLWALFHFSLTRLIFPARLVADHIGVSTNIIRRWYIPWERTDEHLPLSHIAEVTHVRGLFWDAISVESSGGLNPLRVFGLSKSRARYFVAQVRERLNATLPDGIDVIDVMDDADGPTGDHVVLGALEASRWRVVLPGVEAAAAERAVAGFLALSEALVERLTDKGVRRLDARAAVVTMMALALSVSTQQSSRCNGLQIKRLDSTSSIVKRFL